MTKNKRVERQAAVPPAQAPRSKWRVGPVVLALAGLCIAVAAWAIWRFVGASPGSAPAPPAAAPLNILLVTLDTTRADHLGAYGSARARTRHLDRLAAEGVRFERAYSPAPITLPAHASLLTGLYPFRHGVRNNGNFYLSDRFDTIATRLKARGYRTAAFVSSFILDRRYGLARGFDTYDDRMEGPKQQVLQLEAERRGDRTSLALLAWLDAYARRDSAKPGPLREEPASQPLPFFVWLHLYDPHEPYRPPPPFREAFADSPYDGEIAFDDAIVAAVLDRIGQLGLRDRTLVAVAGDHGESLGDHGEETHTMFVYEAALRVPLILWKPGLLPEGRVVEEPVRLNDLAPTLLELAGVPTPETTDARSLLPLIQGGRSAAPPPIYAETLLPQLYMNWAALRSVHDGRWKLIEAPRPELYDLASDPGETRNLHDERPQTVKSLGQVLAQLTGGDTGAMTTARLDRETLEKLASLGYVGAGAEPASDGAKASRTDPKDMIAVFNRLRQANSAVRERRFDAALPILRDVLAKDRRNAFAQLVLGSAHMGMGDNRQAIAQYKKYLELVPTSAYAHHWLSICYVRLGDQANALREAEAALAIDRRFTDARIMKGGILASRGDYRGALAELRAAVESDPAKPTIRLDLAKVLAEAGEEPEALSQYKAVLEAQPDFGPALTGLGALYAKQGDYGQAEAALRRALEIEPNDFQARFNLASTYERQGRTAEAVTEYGRVATSKSAPPELRAAARARLAALGAAK
jgi:arylsulfatase A-like enzyme/tetratricopeptide (TPR) repeat protein